MHSPILAPVVALIAWTLVVWVWLYATRLPAMSRAKLPGATMVGTTGAALRDDLIASGERRATWVADNYNHLHEQPTIFYAIAFALALMDLGGGLNLTIAWIYVGLRVAHSLVQISFNRVVVRFSVFVLSSLCLVALTLHAGLALMHAHNS